MMKASDAEQVEDQKTTGTKDSRGCARSLVSLLSFWSLSGQGQRYYCEE